MHNDIAVYDARSLAYALSTNAESGYSLPARRRRDPVAAPWSGRWWAGGDDRGADPHSPRQYQAGRRRRRTVGDADHRRDRAAHAAVLARSGAMAERNRLAAGGGNRGNASVAAVVQELLRNDILSAWSEPGGPRENENVLMTTPEGRQLRMFLQQGGEGSLFRAFYFLNPLLPCAVATMSDGWVIDLPDLMRSLEKAAGAGPNANLIDLHVRAFIAARGDRQINSAVSLVIGTRDPKTFRMRQLGLLRDLQQRHYAHPMPALAAWVAAQLRPDLQEWHNQRDAYRNDRAIGRAGEGRVPRPFAGTGR